MKTTSWDRCRRAAGWIAVGLWTGTAAMAFHERGVAVCGDCHLMHEVDGAAEVRGLISEFPSDICLGCHADNHGAVLGPDPLAPPPEKGGGNFVFLLEDNLNDASDGAMDPILGDAAGHNVVAPGHGLAADVRHSVAPGGTFPSDRLGCTSCHDPHGRDTFRLLYGEGDVQGGLVAFVNPAPDAEGIDLEMGFENPTRHTAYRGGMSGWCANCHGRYHEDVGLGSLEHPVDELLEPEVVDQYNRYNGDDDPDGGIFDSAYIPEVALEDPGAAVDSAAGAGPQSRVTCLSCHRAHASSAPAAGRWDFNVSLLAEDGLVSGSYPIPDPYMSPSQGTLCTKCHEGGPPAGDPSAGPPPF